MNTQPSSSVGLVRGESARLDHEKPSVSSRSTTRISEAARAESRQRAGKGMIFAGFVITVLGVISYCAACFAGGLDADMGDVLLRNAVPFARGTLAVLGLGTLVWLVGSFTYLRGTMDADEEADEESKSTEP